MPGDTLFARDIKNANGRRVGTVTAQKRGALHPGPVVWITIETIAADVLLELSWTETFDLKDALIEAIDAMALHIATSKETPQ